MEDEAANFGPEKPLEENESEKLQDEQTNSTKEQKTVDETLHEMEEENATYLKDKESVTETGELESSLLEEPQKVETQPKEEANTSILQEETEGEDKTSSADLEVTVNSKHHEEITSMETEHPQEITSVETEHPQKITSVETEHPQEITSVETEHPQKITSVETEHPQKITSEETECSQEITSVETEHPQEITSAETEHPQEITSVETEHPQEITSVETEHPQKITSVETKHPQQITSLGTEHPQEITSVEISCVELKSINENTLQEAPQERELIEDTSQSNETEVPQEKGSEEMAQVLNTESGIHLLEEVSVVNTAKPGEIFTKTSTPQPLNLVWSYGFNASLPVHNISCDDKKMIFYASSHTGIVYDCNEHRQYLLQGHGNPISCTAVSGDRRWLVTADIGQDTLLIVWDSFSGVPVHTIYKGLGQGTVGVALSQDARYIATLSYGIPQVMSIWDWTNGRDTPLQSVTLSVDYGTQTFITFSHDDSSLLVSNSDDQVIFYKWNINGLSVHTTPVSDRDFNKPVGYLSQSIFLPGMIHWALTGTSEGCSVVWETSGLYQEGEMKSLQELDLEIKKPVRLMKMHDSPITVITTVNQYIMTGDSAGHVKFFDTNFKLLNWYDTFKFGPIASLSFAYIPKLQQSLKETTHHYPLQSTLEADQFITPDFTFSTRTSYIVHVTTDGNGVDIIMQEHDAVISALATHPNISCFIVGSYSGKLKLWDYQTKQVLMLRQFPDQHHIQCLNFDPQGHYIGIGFTSGQVLIVDALTLQDVVPVFHYARNSITHLSFSHESSYMATADLDRTVSVFICKYSKDNGSNIWTFFARHQAHYKQIESLIFGVFPDSGQTRLLSLGKDRTLVEYDLVNSGEDDLKLLNVDRIEQSAVPTAATWYPQLTKESFLLITNDQYKMKLYNASTKMCRKTLLGPTFGSPLRRLSVLPAPIHYSEGGEEIRRYLAYITTDKVGLLLLPHDGNPHNATCLTAHPGLVSDMAVAHNGQYIFTAGDEDCTVNQWSINTDALEAISQLGGRDLEPFYSLIEGGREGPFFAELEEFFYYAQIRNQGPNSMNQRDISITIPIDQIPFVMRAIGYYPSEQEIEDMLNEVKFSQYVDTGCYVTAIDLSCFIKLYINHRPVFGLSPSDLEHAFKILGTRSSKQLQWSVDRSKLFQLLQERGEHVTEKELIEHLMTLIGGCANPEHEGDYTESPASLLPNIPDQITAVQFAEKLLGLATS